MVSIVITSYQEPKTLPKAIEAVLACIDKWGVKHGEFEVMVIGPDKDTQHIAGIYPEITYIKDKGRGKPAALNIALKTVRGEIIILTDGDVVIGENSIEKIYLPFRNKNVGAVSGRPVTINSRKTLFGYWSHFLTHAAHQMRLHGKAFPCSGYLYAIRNAINHIPENLFSEDAYITKVIRKKGYDVVYAPHAKVYVKYPDNLSDWLKQKIRATGGYIQKIKNQKGRIKFGQQRLAKIKNTRSFGQEIFNGIWLFFSYPKNLKEFWWTVLLYMTRLYLWFMIFWSIKIKKRKFANIWQRVESTK
ncbi:glycosyltransferase [Patescibacteria group bacterium AH-259-L07]|nr:glycosyltransferase [Patescibacteria group bacterium AH-259-L07]